jgi:hypothetical protein
MDRSHLAGTGRPAAPDDVPARAERGAYTTQVWHQALRLCAAAALLLAIAGCQLGPTTPVPSPTAITKAYTPTPTLTPVPSATEQAWFQTYAHGEILPDMRVPIRRSASGEGGWYVVIGTEEGWAQFLAQMGQPAGIWEPVHWDKEILVGALLGVRQGRGYGITISGLDFDGLTMEADVSFDTPTPSQAVSSWVTYPFHFVRVPRVELPVGPIIFDFVSGGRELATQTVDMIDLDILWLPGEAAVVPTPKPVLSTSTPEPTFTATPVPNLQVAGTVLDVMADTLTLRIMPYESDWEYVELTEATSIFFKDGQATTLAQLVPGATINALGYPDEAGFVRAVHIDILGLPTDEQSFAPYRPRDVSLSTIYDGYALPLPLDGISTTVPLTQVLSATQIETLARNGFVVVPGDDQTFASFYTGQAEYAGDPLFISADSVLHLSQLLFDHVLRSTEESSLLPDLATLDREMFDLSWAQYQALAPAATADGQRMAGTALRDAAYFAVPLSLLDPEFTAPEVISPVVGAELSLIAAGDGVAVSPLLDLPDVPEEARLRVDYSQFAPGGRYVPCEGCAPGEAAARYFQALTWHRLLTFRLDQREETRSAILIAHTLATHPAARVLWQRIQIPLAFFDGQDASLTPDQYGDLLDSIWGTVEDVTVFADEVKVDAFVEAVHDLPLPDNPMWTIWQAERPVERTWRFFSLPFQIDPYIFEQTTWEHVGDPEEQRDLPSGIDLAAALGSLEAYRVASQTGDAQYTNYVEQVDKVRNELSALRTAHWTESMHWNWLYVYRALLEDKNAAYPGWMRTAAWRRKEMQSMLGSWTQVRHDAVPAGELVPGDGTERTLAPWGYVEPQPAVYAHLASLARMILDGLDSRLMLSSADRGALVELETWLIFMQDVARRELTSQVLTDQEYQRLAEYSLLVDKVTRLALGAEAGTQDQAVGGQYQEAVAVSVASSQDRQLVEATGRIDQIYVVIERGRQRYLARGGVYSYYEWASTSRQVPGDDAWRAMLDVGDAPPRPAWVKSFVIPE